MIKYIQNLSQRCQCCDSYKMNAPFYEWHSEVTKKLIGIICKKCAVREVFGTKYKQNPSYKKWIEEENGRSKM